MSEIGARARNGDVELVYERLGPPDGEPLLLVMGLAMQMLFWHDDLCAEFVRQGFSPVRFDNRDVGASTHLTGRGAPSLPAVLAAPRAVAPYRVSDMAADAVAVLDALGWESAHVVGTSMGGMIAQALAIEHPHRVRSLTSVMSTPSPRIGRPTFGATLALAARPARSAEQAAERVVRTFRVIGSPGYPLDEDWLRDYGRRAFARGHDPAGGRRQLAAINASHSRVAGPARSPGSDAGGARRGRPAGPAGGWPGHRGGGAGRAAADVPRDGAQPAPRAVADGRRRDRRARRPDRRG